MVARMLLRPDASPIVASLEDAPETEISKGKKIKKLAKADEKGFLQFHVRSSHLPSQLTSQDTSKCFVGDVQKLVDDVVEDPDAANDSVGGP
jgi:hypothetical protein